LKILITGASGFIGSHLVYSLSYSNLQRNELICMTSVESLVGCFDVQIRVIKADVSNYAELIKAMTGIDVADLRNRYIIIFNAQF
jgi:nucleoside-diphosphate-sugar epimerase